MRRHKLSPESGAYKTYLQMKPPWQADSGSTQGAVDAREPSSPLDFNIHTIKLITRRATRHVLPI